MLIKLGGVYKGATGKREVVDLRYNEVISCCEVKFVNIVNGKEGFCKYSEFENWIRRRKKRVRRK